MSLALPALLASVAAGISAGAPALGELDSFEAFFKANAPGKDYKYGRHTLGLMEALQRAAERYRAGACSYLIVEMPPRHGKSDVVSRRFPAWFLAREQDSEIIEASYNYSLASEMSYDVRKLLWERGGRYGVGLQRDRKAVGCWRVRGRKGALRAAGIGGTITGHGANLLIIDDYLKSRAEAESALTRDKQWSAFESDMMTRLAPTHVVVIVANRWHVDDLVGRILRRNDPASGDYEEEFPRFERVTFKAQADDGAWLFPERFSDRWYRATRAAVGPYAWASQYQQEPTLRTGNLLRVDRVEIVERSAAPEGLRWRRGWDLASTGAERVKEDPDYSVGTLAAWDARNRHLWIADVIRGQWQAPERDRRMRAAALADGSAVHVRIETVAGYVDAFQRAKENLAGAAIVRSVTPHKDKVSRASVLEPVFDAGGVKIVKAAWNRDWLEELAAFPKARHDDQVDSLVVAVGDDVAGKGRTGISV